MSHAQIASSDTVGINIRFHLAKPLAMDAILSHTVCVKSCEYPRNFCDYHCLTQPFNIAL